MQHVNFYPWRGAKYDTGINNKRILILGESHYCEDYDKSQKSRHKCPKEFDNYCMSCHMDRECHEKTIDTIVEHLSSENYRTHKTFETHVNGHSLSEKERFEFWHHLAFYEYIQYAQPKPKMPLKQGNPTQNRNAFLEVLELLKPDKIIIWGKRFYHLLLNEFGGEIIVHPTYPGAWNWKINNIDILIFDHPCCPYGKSSKLGQIIREFIFQTGHVGE